MTVKFETQSIRTLAYFEKKTRVHARDCIITDDCIYFLVEPEKVGMAIGKNGAVIRDVRRAFGKNVKVLGYYPEPEDMLRNLMPGIKSMDMSNGSIIVTIPREDRVAAIGRNGANIKIAREIMNRHFSFKTLKLR
jgi:N utilization substance protein A